jgi:flagellar biosynthesis protein FliR
MARRTVSADAMWPWGLSVALLAVRLTVAVALSPALAAYGIPATVRLALVFALAALTFAHRPPLAAAAGWMSAPGSLLAAVAAEVMIGALLGLALHVVMAALVLAGRLMDVQIGFAIGSIFDPVTQASSNVLGSLVSLLGVTLFVLGDVHLRLAQLVSQSIDVLPLGELPTLAEPGRPLLAAGAMFTLGAAFAAPVAAALLLTDIAIGVASRNMPQLNVLILAMPVKVVVGYAVLALSVASWGPWLQQGLDRTIAAMGLL